MARQLGRNPQFVPAAAELLTALMRLDGPASAQLVAEAGEIADLVAERPVLAARLADRIADRVKRSAAVEPQVLLAAARALAEQGDATSGFFSIALTHAGQAYGWSQPWRDRLRTLREHPVPDVRDAAFDISMASE